MLAAVLLLGYGILRFLLAFTRQPDAQLGLVLGPPSVGQLLSAAMLVAGFTLLDVVLPRGHPAPEPN
jgi:phosphatidylglycerol:prolipoprotein diacylglycerol transferase